MKALTKAQIASEISTKSGLTKTQVNEVLAALGEVVAAAARAR